MPIYMPCTCGRRLKVKEELAGQKVRCPECAVVLDVPLPEGEQAEDKGPSTLQAGSSERSANDPSSSVTDRPLSQAEPKEVDVPACRSISVNLDDAPYRRTFRFRDEHESPRAPLGQSWSTNLNAGMAGGLLMMLIAVVWFFGGLMFGVAFFYPPILFIFGVGSFFRGFTNRE